MTRKQSVITTDINRIPATIVQHDSIQVIDVLLWWCKLLIFFNRSFNWLLLVSKTQKKTFHSVTEFQAVSGSADELNAGTSCVNNILPQLNNTHLYHLHRTISTAHHCKVLFQAHEKFLATPTTLFLNLVYYLFIVWGLTACAFKRNKSLVKRFLSAIVFFKSRKKFFLLTYVNSCQPIHCLHPIIHEMQQMNRD